MHTQLTPCVPVNTFIMHDDDLNIIALTISPPILLPPTYVLYDDEDDNDDDVLYDDDDDDDDDDLAPNSPVCDSGEYISGSGWCQPCPSGRFANATGCHICPGMN